MEGRKDIYGELNEKFWTTFWVSQFFSFVKRSSFLCSSKYL